MSLNSLENAIKIVSPEDWIPILNILYLQWNMSIQFPDKMNDKQNIRIHLLKIRSIYEEMFLLKPRNPLQIRSKNLLCDIITMRYPRLLTSTLLPGSIHKLSFSSIMVNYFESCWLCVLIISLSTLGSFKKYFLKI